MHQFNCAASARNKCCAAKREQAQAFDSIAAILKILKNNMHKKGPFVIMRIILILNKPMAQ